MSEGRAAAASQSTTLSGGGLDIAIRVTNVGSLAFTVTNLVLGAVMNDMSSNRVIEPVGNLVFDSGALPSFSLGPNEATTDLLFSKGNLDLGTAESILAHSSSLVLKVAVYEIVDENGVPFRHDLTAINAKTASVIIDYGGLRRTERYNVATNRDPNVLRISASEAMGDILAIPYETGGLQPDALATVRDIGTDAATDTYWLVLYVTTDGVSNMVHLYDPAVEGFSFSDISLKSGDVLHLVYYTDTDGDGLGNREEFAYGSSPFHTDTDGDGLGDREEVYRWKLRPNRADTDGDGVPDGRERFHSIATTGYSLSAVTASDEMWSAGHGCYLGFPVWKCGELDGSTDWIIEDLTQVGTASDWASVRGHSAKITATDRQGGQWYWGQAVSNPASISDSWVSIAMPWNGAGIGVTSDGKLWSYGSLTLPRVQVGTDTDWRTVYSGYGTYYAIRADGTLWSWGNGMGFGLGLGDEVSRTDPTQVGSAGGWKDVSTDRYHTIALREDGTLWTWGKADHGIMGTGASGLVTHPTPVQIGTDNDWVDVAAASRAGAALKADGTLWTWGRDGYHGSGGPDVLAPKRLGNSTDWVSINAKHNNVMALQRNGSAWGWGDNFFSQLGYDSPGHIATPVPIVIRP